MSPQRIQLRRKKGWRKPEGAIVVSRPSKWGNPFRVTTCCRAECGDGFTWCVTAGARSVEHIGTFATRAEASAFAVECYANWLLPAHRLFVAATELRGKDLACWCPLDSPCHADVLLEIANAPEDGTP